ncbi:PLDc_N domain-containing protein [Rhodococcus sp. KBS0724]|nr:PLDc_N domain-containing protein [Rhodococcus sp. KBS0724]
MGYTYALHQSRTKQLLGPSTVTRPHRQEKGNPVYTVNASTSLDSATVRKDEMEDSNVDNEVSQPMVPIGFDIAWSVMMILWIVLTVAAVVSIVRSDADPVAKIGWSALAVILPILGPAAWFLASRLRQNAL